MSADRVERQFALWTERLGIALTAEQLARFGRYYGLLVEWNEKMNLTGITERAAVYEKHFYDSLSLALAIDFHGQQTIADIGSGAGFPGIPLAIAFPHLRVTIVDSLAKRIRFLEEAAGQLELTTVAAIHGRAEDVGRLQAHRDRYDVVTARAVARLAALNELCLPFARAGGLFIAMKGADIEEELEESRFSAGKLNGEVRDVVALTLPDEGSQRHLVICAKTGPTPAAYPRKAGLPLKAPLVK